MHSWAAPPLTVSPQRVCRKALVKLSPRNTQARMSSHFPVGSLSTHATRISYVLSPCQALVQGLGYSSEHKQSRCVHGASILVREDAINKQIVLGEVLSAKKKNQPE